MKTKVTLTQLNVESFVTGNGSRQVKGGNITNPTLTFFETCPGSLVPYDCGGETRDVMLCS